MLAYQGRHGWDTGFIAHLVYGLCLSLAFNTWDWLVIGWSIVRTLTPKPCVPARRTRATAFTSEGSSRGSAAVPRRWCVRQGGPDNRAHTG